MIKKCLICNKEFIVKPSHMKRRKTCSRECLKKLKSITMKGAGNHQFGLTGESNGSFKNKFSIKNGYVFIFLPEHPYCIFNGRIKYHRVIAEKQKNIKKEFLDENGFLLPTIDVHHKDFNKLNNEPDNLQILTRSEHTKLHNKYKQIIRNKNNGKIIGVFKRGELLENCNVNQQPS